MDLCVCVHGCVHMCVSGQFRADFVLKSALKKRKKFGKVSEKLQYI